MVNWAFVKEIRSLGQKRGPLVNFTLGGKDIFPWDWRFGGLAFLFGVKGLMGIPGDQKIPFLPKPNFTFFQSLGSGFHRG